MGREDVVRPNASSRFLTVARIYTREGNPDSDFSRERFRFVHLADDRDMFS
jgi:hypothetical protein